MINVICDRCGYKWDCESKLIFVTCPSCKKSTLRVKKEKKAKKPSQKSRD